VLDHPNVVVRLPPFLWTLIATHVLAPLEELAEAFSSARSALSRVQAALGALVWSMIFKVRSGSNVGTTAATAATASANARFSNWIKDR